MTTWIIGALLGALGALCPWFMLRGTALLVRRRSQAGLVSMVLGFGFGALALLALFSVPRLYMRYLVMTESGAATAALGQSFSRGLGEIYGTAPLTLGLGAALSIWQALLIYRRIDLLDPKGARPSAE